MEHYINMVGLDGERSYPLHSHTQYEILYYLEGTGHQHTSVGDIPFSGGTLIIFPPGVHHGTVSLNGFKLFAMRSDKFKNLLSFTSPVVLHDTESFDGEALVNMIYRNRMAGDGYLTSLIDTFCHFILSNLQYEDDLSRAVRQVADKISKNFYSSTLNPAALLRESGYAEDYIRAHFKKIIGKTPNGYLTDLRINHALYLIEVYKDSISLSSISEKCGYTDYVYFSKKFKEHTGVSPKEFLKKKCIA